MMNGGESPGSRTRPPTVLPIDNLIPAIHVSDNNGLRDVIQMPNFCDKLREFIFFHRVWIPIVWSK